MKLKNIKKWTAGVLAAVISGVLVWWLTEVIRPKPQLEPKGKPIVVLSKVYRSPGYFTYSTNYYDFDKPQELSSATTTADFFFDFNSSDRGTKIVVEPHNGAQFAPRCPDLFPWEINSNELTAAKGIYSVPQGKNIPCITSEGMPCTFNLRIEDNGQFTVSFVLYELQ